MLGTVKLELGALCLFVIPGRTLTHSALFRQLWEPGITVLTAGGLRWEQNTAPRPPPAQPYLL